MEMISWRGSARVAVLYFLTSRALIFGIWLCASCITVDTPPAGTVFGAATISLDGSRIATGLRKLAFYNDAGWYAGIAGEGYGRVDSIARAWRTEHFFRCIRCCGAAQPRW